MKSIERMPVVEQVTARLKEYIQSDERQVGEKLPTERELCDDLNVGRSTLREAVRILQASGFVENLSLIHIYSGNWRPRLNTKFRK